MVLPKDHKRGDFPLYKSPKKNKEASVETLEIEIPQGRGTGNKKPIGARGLTNEERNTALSKRTNSGRAMWMKTTEKWPTLSNVPSLPDEEDPDENDLMLRDSTKSKKPKKWTNIEWIGAILMAVSVLGLVILALVMISQDTTTHAPEEFYPDPIPPQETSVCDNINSELSEAATSCCYPETWTDSLIEKFLCLGVGGGLYWMFSNPTPPPRPPTNWEVARQVGMDMGPKCGHLGVLALFGVVAWGIFKPTDWRRRSPACLQNVFFCLGA